MRSRNIPAVDLASRLREGGFHAWLQQAGIGALQPAEHYGLALVLGGVEVTMQELVGLYATLAERGVQRPLRRRAGGAPAEGQQLLSPEAALLTLQMLTQDNPPPREPRALAGGCGAVSQALATVQRSAQTRMDIVSRERRRLRGPRGAPSSPGRRLRGAVEDPSWRPGRLRGAVEDPSWRPGRLRGAVEGLSPRRGRQREAVEGLSRPGRQARGALEAPARSEATSCSGSPCGTSWDFLGKSKARHDRQERHAAL